MKNENRFTLAKDVTLVTSPEKVGTANQFQRAYHLLLSEGFASRNYEELNTLLRTAENKNIIATYTPIKNAFQALEGLKLYLGESVIHEFKGTIKNRVKKYNTQKEQDLKQENLISKYQQIMRTIDEHGQGQPCIQHLDVCHNNRFAPRIMDRSLYNQVDTPIKRLMTEDISFIDALLD